MGRKTYDSSMVSCFPESFKMMLPDGYRIDTEYDEDWNEIISLRGGFYYNEDGEEDFEFTCNFITLNHKADDRDSWVREGKLKKDFVPGLKLGAVADSLIEAQRDMQWT